MKALKLLLALIICTVALGFGGTAQVGAQYNGCSGTCRSGGCFSGESSIGVCTNGYTCCGTGTVLVGTKNCASDTLCGINGCGPDTMWIQYWNCPSTSTCNNLIGCVKNGGACMTLSYCTSGCHPTSCSPICGLGGCAGGCGSIDDCGGVSCSSCPGGGGAGGGGGGGSTNTPTIQQVGNLRARAVAIDASVTSCAQVRASTNYLASTLSLSPYVAPGSQSVSGATYATWGGAYVDTYTLSNAVGAGYVLKYACWQTDIPAAQGSSLTADLPANATLTWDLGYSNGTSWAQTRGGDVYAASGLSSPIPPGTTPRYGLLDANSGLPGVATYGVSYDFDSDAASAGDAFISTTGWLVNETYAPTDFYSILYHRYDSPNPDYSGDTTFTNKLASGTYYVDGNLTIDTNPWSVAAGESIVVLVNGNLTINQDINLSGTGFVSFIVNGDITVASSVGVSSASSIPSVEGIYITSPTGTFSTGASSVAGSERFVAEGIFIAGNFDLARDLDSVGANNTTASELFIYNPQLLITMPDEMRDIPLTWQEVAP